MGSMYGIFAKIRWFFLVYCRYIYQDHEIGDEVTYCRIFIWMLNLNSFSEFKHIMLVQHVCFLLIGSLNFENLNIYRKTTGHYVTVRMTNKTSANPIVYLPTFIRKQIIQANIPHTQTILCVSAKPRVLSRRPCHGWGNIHRSGRAGPRNVDGFVVGHHRHWQNTHDTVQLRLSTQRNNGILVGGFNPIWKILVILDDFRR